MIRQSHRTYTNNVIKYILHFTKFTVWLFRKQFDVLLSSSNAVKSPSTYPESYCSCCCCSFQVLRYLPYSQIDALAQDTGMYWIQSYFRHVWAPPVFFFTLPARSHHSPAFSIHSITRIGHYRLTVSWLQSQDHKPRSFRYAAPHLWNKLSPTLRVPYQFNPSSSPSSTPSSYSDPGPFVDISRGVSHSHLKTFLFSKSFHP